MEQLIFGDGLVGDRWPGDGPTVLLLHAGVADSRSWYETAELLADVGTVVAYDRRGFGRTPPSPVPYDDLADLLTVLDEVSPDPIWLVGSSRGGRLALDAATAHPTRVAGLVLLAPAVSGAPQADVDAVTSRLDELIEQAADAGDLAEANRLESLLWLDGPEGPEGRVGDPARSLFLAMNAVVLEHEAAHVAMPAQPAAQNAWNRLGDLRMPVAVGCGNLDVPQLVDRCRQIAELVPGAACHVFPGMAHLPYLEQPAVVAGLIRTTVAGSTSLAR